MAMSHSGRLVGTGRSDGWVEPAGPRTVRSITPHARIAGIALVVVLLLAGFVGQRVYVMNLTYRLEAEAARGRELAQQNEYLQLEVARARSLDRVEAVARGRLGMVPADRREVVVIPADPGAAPAPAAATALARHEPRTQGAGGWLSSFLVWANDRWAGRTAEAGSSRQP